MRVTPVIGHSLSMNNSTKNKNNNVVNNQPQQSFKGYGWVVTDEFYKYLKSSVVDDALRAARDAVEVLKAKTSERLTYRIGATNGRFEKELIDLNPFVYDVYDVGVIKMEPYFPDEPARALMNGYLDPNLYKKLGSYYREDMLRPYPTLIENTRNMTPVYFGIPKFNTYSKLYERLSAFDEAAVLKHKMDNSSPTTYLK